MKKVPLYEPSEHTLRKYVLSLFDEQKLEARQRLQLVEDELAWGRTDRRRVTLLGQRGKLQKALVRLEKMWELFERLLKTGAKPRYEARSVPQRQRAKRYYHGKSTYSFCVVEIRRRDDGIEVIAEVLGEAGRPLRFKTQRAARWRAEELEGKS